MGINKIIKTKNNVSKVTLGAIDVLEDNYVEILLKEVSAYYDNKTQPSYEVEAMYLCEKFENIIIEFQKKYLILKGG